MPDYILAIDQGTTSSRAMIFDAQLRPVSVAQQEFTQHFPRDGWVEHDPEDIWQSVLAVVRNALRDASLAAGDIRAIGITNQRETTLLWDAETGERLDKDRFRRDLGGVEDAYRYIFEKVHS